MLEIMLETLLVLKLERTEPSAGSPPSQLRIQLSWTIEHPHEPVKFL